MNPQELLEQIYARKWVAVAALIIGLVVRLLKSDTKIPIDIPPRWRAPLALGLGAAAGALDKLSHVDNVTWTTALLEGVLAAGFAMLGHVFVIDSARDGKELPIPGLIKPGEPPSPGKPPTIPPPALDLPNVNTPISDDPNRPLSRVVARGFTLACMAWLVSCTFAGCALFTKENAPSTVLTFEQLACIAEHAFVNDATLNTICNLLTGDQQRAGKQLASANRAGLARASASKASSDGGVCAPDAGVSAEGGAR